MGLSPGGPFDAQQSGDGDFPLAGVAEAVVVRNDDPEGLSRVTLSFPWLDADMESGWARVVVPFGAETTVPGVGDEVLVAFSQGDLRFPYVLGRIPNRRTP